MAGTISSKIRNIYLRFVGAPSDESTKQETADIESHLQGLKLEETPEEIEAGEKAAKATDSKDTYGALGGAIYQGRPENPLND